MKSSKFRILLLLIVSIVLFSKPIFAKNIMKNDDKGFWLENDDQRYYVNTWMWVDMANNGVNYHCYFGDDGYMLVNTVAPDGTQINEFGQAIYNGVPITYTSNVLNKTTNTSKYIINLGDNLQDALNTLHTYSIDYSTPISNCIEYYDDEGKGHFYYFDSTGKCVVDIDMLQCDINGANALMNERMQRETAKLISHFKEEPKENYIFMSANSYSSIYGRLLERNISTDGWYTFCDLMFDMDYYDLLTVWSDLEKLIY